MLLKKHKGKQWTKKILKENCKNIHPAKSEEFLHKDDEKALSALKKIPFFDKICGKFIELFNERVRNVEDMSTKIRISEKQLPRIYHMTQNITQKLGIEMPQLYLELNRDPNAYTYGNQSATITITSGLLECMEDDEVYAVLAHECGHIACQHLLYHTMGQFILNGSIFGFNLLDSNGFFATAISIPLKLAFYHWMRCSEFSADRAAAICCKGSTPVVETMMRLAGGTMHIDKEIDQKLFVDQALDYKDLLKESKLNKAIEFVSICSSTHPLLSVRAHESIQWTESEEFKNILKAMYLK